MLMAWAIAEGVRAKVLLRSGVRKEERKTVEL
jgi:hypothetical protein